MESCNILLQSDALQFGLKENSSCTNAIYILRTVVEYYWNNNCTVNTCALDISKTLDRVDQYALLNLRIDRGILKCIISLMFDWFKKSTAMVRWGNSLSKKFSINAGVRQCGLLSPIFFAIYVDILVQKLKQTGVGCNINDQFFGCLFYADDIILLAHTLRGMQKMLDICSEFAIEFDIKFNATKPIALRFWKRFNMPRMSLILSGAKLNFVQSVKYLGIYMCAGQSFKCSIEQAKAKFYRSFNYLLYKNKHALSELVSVNLMKSDSIPLLVYGTEALNRSKSDLSKLGKCMNVAVMKIFGTQDTNNIAFVRHIFNLLKLSEIIRTRKCNFLSRLLSTGLYNDLFVNG